jgi:hypothetical protein
LTTRIHILQKDLPTEFHYSIKSALRHLNEYLEIKLEANIRSKDGATKGLSLYSEKSKTSWTIRSVRPVTGKRVVFNKEFRCIHHGRRTKVNSQANPGTRNTNCQAILNSTIFAIRTPKRNYNKKKITHDPNKPCQIYLRLKHNHPIIRVRCCKHCSRRNAFSEVDHCVLKVQRSM